MESYGFASPTSSFFAYSAAEAAFFLFGLHTPRTSPSRTPTHPWMWKRALNPLPTNPTPNRPSLDFFMRSSPKGVDVSSSLVSHLPYPASQHRVLPPPASPPRSQYETPSFARAEGGHPFHSGTKVFPLYFRSCTPIALDQNPDAVKSRNELKNATPLLCSGFAFFGQAMSS